MLLFVCVFVCLCGDMGVVPAAPGVAGVAIVVVVVVVLLLLVVSLLMLLLWFRCCCWC